MSFLKAFDNDSREETKSLPDTQRRKDYWKYSKTEKPLVQSLRREEVNIYVLSCQQRVAVTSCFLTKLSGF